MMNVASLDFRCFLGMLRDGDEGAAARIMALYGGQMLRVVRRRLSPQLRMRFDSMDFVQSAWATFFRQADRLRDFVNSSELLRFLLAITRNKVSDQVRRNVTSSKRDMRRECSLTPFASDFTSNFIQCYDLRFGTPVQLAEVREFWDLFLSNQPFMSRRVVELRCLGATYEEVAEALDMHERTARKIMRRVVDEWEARKPIRSEINPLTPPNPPAVR